MRVRCLSAHPVSPAWQPGTFLSYSLSRRGMHKCSVCSSDAVSCNPPSQLAPESIGKVIKLCKQYP